MRAALGGAKLEQVKAVSVEGPFRREMGQRQAEGTVVMVLQGPDKMHRSEDTEFPGGMSIERITAVSGATSWEDTQNRGGMGGGMQIMMRGPGGAEMSEEAREKMRTTRLTAEMQRWMFALLAAPAGEVTYAGVAESPDGKADTLEMKDVRGQAVRLFVDQQTHLPLMLAFSEVRPRMMMQGGPGGRRGGGPGRPGAAAGGRCRCRCGRHRPGQRPTEEEIRQRIAAMPPPTPSAVQMSFADYTTVDGVKFPKQVSVSRRRHAVGRVDAREDQGQPVAQGRLLRQEVDRLRRCVVREVIGARHASSSVARHRHRSPPCSSRQGRPPSPRTVPAPPRCA